MSVITVQKEFNEIQTMLFKRADLHVVVIGCDKCAKVSQTGGANEVRKIREDLHQGKYMILKPDGLVDALEEGLCDPEAVTRQLAPLKPFKGQFQLLVMACGAALKCVSDLLPNVPIVPGLNTLGPGVRDQLACISCGDCRFGTHGCQMTRLLALQVKRLNESYATVETEVSH